MSRAACRHNLIFAHLWCVFEHRDDQQEIYKLEEDSVTLRIEEQTQLCREVIQHGDHETAKAIKYRLVAE